MRFYLPLIEDYLKKANIKTKPQVSVYSSINQPYPIASVEVATSNQTPEILNLFLGMDMGDLQYQLISELDASPTFHRETLPEAKLSKFLKLPPMMIEEIENYVNSDSGNSKFFLRNELSTSQSSGLQKCFKDTNAKKVMQTLAAANKPWQSYNLRFAESDHSTTVFRKISQTDLSFIEEQLYPNYLINGNCPKFWVGIDNTIHLDSVSNILKTNDLPDALLILGSHQNDTLTDNMLRSIEAKVKRTGPTLIANNYKLNVGWKNALQEMIKPAVYSFDNSIPYNSSISKITCENVDTMGRKLPISSLFNLTANNSNTISLENRPITNISIESKNLLYKDQSNLIRLHVDRCSINYGNNATDEEEILSAGAVVQVVLPYLYSIYNGPYVIENIEYITDRLAPEQIFVNLDLVSTGLDLTCYEKLQDHKDSNNFNLSFAPAILTDLLLKSN